ncbi:MAG: hypothetical protein A3I89_02650 [Candidatus Harrisonbacteria bacterium RIFCSPLOWO2_02_FULL_41_11]|nr:MAG: hypothetical protein A3I89_02650 [Candidatus Harrisonbacteria bacterium RIFCSPLOWO2_02_FULL_41_11]
MKIVYRVIGLIAIAITIGMLTPMPAFRFFSIDIKAHDAKPDPCQQYQENALKYIQMTEEYRKKEWWPGEAASVAAAYSSYYLVCRDLEKRQNR